MIEMPPGRELAHDAEQHLRFALGQRRGGLVEDQHRGSRASAPWRSRRAAGCEMDSVLDQRGRGRCPPAQLLEGAPCLGFERRDSPSTRFRAQALISAIKMFSATDTSGQSAIS